jgi:hypothetical protein
MEATTYDLYRGDDRLGTVTMKSELCDFPWYGGSFQAAPAYAAVKQLFSEELRLLQADEMDAWEEVWAEIEEPGLKLLPTDGGAAISELLIHLDGEEAWWRY